MNPQPPPAISTSTSESYTPSPQEYPSVAAAALSNSTTNPNHVESGRKRKSGLPNSRGVANLTPEQLSKKRANDREAQRAIRERTKTTIETLEKRIQELESQQPYQELQRVAQERDRALEECNQLRHKLAMVQSVIAGPSQSTQTPQPQPQQPNLHGTFDVFDEFIYPTWLTAGDTELATLTAQQSPLPPLNPQYSASGAEQAQQHVHPELRSPHGDTNSPALSHSRNSSYESRIPSQASISERNSTNGVRLDLNYVLEPKQQTPTSSPMQGPQTYPLTSATETPIYARLPAHSPPTCPLDSLLLDFLRDRQKQINDGIPIGDVAGPEYPSFTDLLDRPPTPENMAHPVSLLMTDVISKFPDISGLPEKVAVRYIMFMIMRWMICPCEECYERLPPWVRPFQEQLETPHPIWNDHVPWPAIRMRLMSTPVRLEDFFISFTSRIYVNWPYPDNQILITSVDDPSSVRLNPVFESHLRDLNNWSLASAFKTTYPELVDDSVRIED